MTIRALKIWRVTLEAIRMVCICLLAISLLLLLIFKHIDMLIVTLFIAAAVTLCTLILLSIKESVKNRTYSQRVWYYKK